MKPFNPQPVNARCRICRVVTPDKHHHPPWQVLGWLWKGHWTWKVFILVSTFHIALAVGVWVVPAVRKAAGW